MCLFESVVLRVTERRVPIDTPQSNPTRAQLSKLQWFEIHFVRSLTVAEVVRALQPLAYRPLIGWLRRTPAVALELRGSADGVRWLVGMDTSISEELAAQVRAQLPGLVLVALPNPPRRPMQVVANVHLSNLTGVLRTDMSASVTAGLLEGMASLGRDVSAVLQWVVGPAQSRSRKPESFSVTRALGLVAVAKESADDRQVWKRKTHEPLLLVRGRIGARARSLESARLVVRRLGEALQVVSSSHVELRVPRASVRGTRQLDSAAANNRWSGVLNVAELAGVVGWPVEATASLHARLGRHYPAPAQITVPVERGGQPDGRVLGAGLHPAQADHLVTLPTESAVHHLHVVGPTGSGKSTLLARLLLADVRAGRSVFVLEPRGDLVEAVVAGVPAERREDVVAIEPGSSEKVVGFNPLAGPREDAEQRADHLLYLFRELYGTSLGPRSADVLMHALVALARSDQGTLADLPVLLTNAAFRRRVLGVVNDPLVLAPFFSWYDGLSEAERQQVVAPVLNKTRAFLSRTPIRRLLGQAAPRFGLDELFLRPRIVLVNLNSGVIGSETSQMIGALLVTQLWQAMQRRALVASTHRTPAMVVIDEVQQYLRLPVDLGDLFAQARGLGVGLTVAHQHMAQLPPKLRAGITANARNRVVFRPSSEDASSLATILGGGLMADDLALLGAHEAYAEVLVNRRISEPFLVRTLPPDTRALGDPAVLRRQSAQWYGVDGVELDARLRARWHGGDEAASSPIGQIPRRPRP